MSDPAKNNHAGEDGALKTRLDALTKALDEKRQDTQRTVEADRKVANTGIGKAIGTGFRVASELAGGILVGGFLGWLIDYGAGTTPWFLLLFLILGVMAGFWNVYKLAARSDSSTQPPAS